MSPPDGSLWNNVVIVKQKDAKLSNQSFCLKMKKQHYGFSHDKKILVRYYNQFDRK